MFADVLGLLLELAFSPLKVELPLPDLLQPCGIARRLGCRGVFERVGVQRVGGREGVFVITWQVRASRVRRVRVDNRGSDWCALMIQMMDQRQPEER